METEAPIAAPVMVSTLRTTHRKEHYKSMSVLILSKTHISIGALCILLQCILIGIRSPHHFIGQGIWAGFFFVLTGVFGTASSRRKTASLIVTFLSLAIFSAVLALLFIMVNAIEMLPWFYRSHNESYKRYSIMTINAIMILMGVIEAVIAIVSSGLSCHGLSGSSQNQPVVMAGQVQYIQGPDGQQQMVILPLDQQASGMAAGPTPNPDQSEPPPYVQDSPPPTYTECETKLPIPD